MNEAIAFLIYPYWNVNSKGKKMNEAIAIVSNLSILECKFKTII